MTINPGELNHFCTLLKKAGSDTNTFGESDGELVVYGTVWAKVMQERTGLEIREGGQVIAKSPFTLLILWRDDIRPDHVVEFEGRQLQITNIRDHDGKRISLFLECNEYASSHA